MPTNNDVAEAFLNAAREAEKTILARRGGGQGPPRTPSGTRVKYQQPPPEPRSKQAQENTEQPC